MSFVHLCGSTFILGKSVVPSTSSAQQVKHSNGTSKLCPRVAAGKLNGGVVSSKYLQTRTRTMRSKSINIGARCVR
jgi:hypothetical protein